MESLKNCVVENEADIGFADGDADRMMAVDEKVIWWMEIYNSYNGAGTEEEAVEK